MEGMAKRNSAPLHHPHGVEEGRTSSTKEGAGAERGSPFQAAGTPGEPEALQEKVCRGESSFCCCARNSGSLRCVDRAEQLPLVCPDNGFSLLEVALPGLGQELPNLLAPGHTL